MILKLTCPCGRLLATATRPKSRPQVASDSYGPSVTAQPSVERSERVPDAHPTAITYRLRCSRSRDATSRQTWRAHPAFASQVGAGPRRERRPDACGADHQFGESALAKVWNEKRQQRQRVAVVVLGVEL